MKVLFINQSKSKTYNKSCVLGSYSLHFFFLFFFFSLAAQAVELSTFIPLQYGATKCVLVGDPNQLPATVLSQSASSFGYQQSMFERRLKGGDDVCLLNIQYRMHKDISVFPSRLFYQSKVIDAFPSNSSFIQEWHEDTRFPPYCFYHVESSSENIRFKSYFNKEEALALAEIIEGELFSPLISILQD